VETLVFLRRQSFIFFFRKQLRKSRITPWAKKYKLDKTKTFSSTHDHYLGNTRSGGIKASLEVRKSRAFSFFASSCFPPTVVMTLRFYSRSSSVHIGVVRVVLIIIFVVFSLSLSLSLSLILCYSISATNFLQQRNGNVVATDECVS
jgi:hypothetical protein